MYRRINLWIFLMVCEKMVFSQCLGTLVNTSLGIIEGRHTKSYEGRSVIAFEGIPYAKPPVGELRFKEAQPPEPWTGVLAANKTYVCIQYSAKLPVRSTRGTEDCLYLYVYVPRETINASETLDVVIHLHGGNFVSGNPSSSNSAYLMDRDLIYVSMNYRLGILGFLSIGNDLVSDNNGLKDQTLAMKWVKDNIKFFGGNPNSITLVGDSTGATCVHFHYLSPLSKGLFNRGVSQSGTALQKSAIVKNPLLDTKQLGQIFNCKLDSPETLIECLKRLPADDITLTLGNFFVFANIYPSDTFTPVIENGPRAFLPDHPYKLLKEGKIHDYPWIVSSVKDEGIFPTAYFSMFGHLQTLDDHWNDLIPLTLQYHRAVEDRDKSLFISKSVREYYLRNETISKENINDLVKLYTDRLYLTIILNAVRLHANVSKSPVYHYISEYLMDLQIVFKGGLKGVGHGDDAYLLYRQDNHTILSESDTKMKNIFIDMMYSFATTGKPRVKGVEWKPVSVAEKSINYMQILSPNDIHMARVNETETSRFWNSLPILENEKLF